MQVKLLRVAKLAALLGGIAAATAASTWAAAAQSKGRELTTDRPDATETPFTVEPGRVQIEASALSYVRDRQGGVRTEEWEIAPTNVRVGITRATELGIFVTPQVRITEQARGGPKTSVRGFGDVVLRGKANFWGNDGGATGFGVMVDVKLPTAKTGIGNDKTEFAVIFPGTFEVGGGWEGAAMTVFEGAYTEALRRELVWTNTLSFARELMTDVGTFFEVVSSTGAGRHQFTFNWGATRRFGPDLQLDGGINIGISQTAPDLGVFAGLSRRF